MPGASEAVPTITNTASPQSVGSKRFKPHTVSTAAALAPVQFFAGTTIEDITFEDLSSIIRHIDVSGVSLDVSGSDNEDVGRWGEEWVYEYLQHVYNEEIQNQQVDITWCNRETESTRPFDIAIEIFKPNHKSEVHFIEVKSTKAEAKEMFEVSLQQVLMAHEKKHFYHIYRVYNAGSAADKIKLKILRNVTQLMGGKVVQMCMFI